MNLFFSWLSRQLDNIGNLSFFECQTYLNPGPTETVTSSPNPILGRIDVNAGHGAGKSTEMVIDEQAEMYTFIANETGAKWED